MKKLNLLLVAMLLATVFMVSCSKDEDETTPDYVGTWVYTYTTDWGTYGDIWDTVDMKTTLVLTKGGFTSIDQEKVNGVFVDVEGIKGTISSSGSTLSMTITQFGEDENTDDTNYELTWYADGSTEFLVYKSIIEGFGGSLTSQGTYSVEGDKLTTITDGDTTVFTKVQ